MKALRKAMLIALVLVVAMILVGCQNVVIEDGTTGVVIRDGVVSDDYWGPGRYNLDDSNRTSVRTINNKVQTINFSNPVEGQSKDNIIVNATGGYGFSYRIGEGAKSVWLVKNISDLSSAVPQLLVENALKDAMLELDAENVTRRVYLEPIFKEVLQKRIDEYLGYRNGDDMTLISVVSVSVGNLSLEEAYDKEISRKANLAKRAENDKLEYELNIASAETQAELAKYEAERLTAGWEELSKKFTPEVAAYLIIEKWDGQCTPGSPIEQLVEYYVGNALESQDKVG